MQNLVNNKMFFMLFLNFIIISAFFIYGYYTFRLLVFKNIDDCLISAAYCTNYALGVDFHDKIENKHSISNEEHDKNVMLLSDVALKCNVDYTYTLMLNESKEVVFTALSATQDEINNKSYAKFYKVYEKPSELTLNAFNKINEILVEEYEDEYGYFRSVLIPKVTKNGKKYLVGADILINNIKKVLNTFLINFFLFSILIFIISTFMIIHIFKKKVRVINKDGSV